MVGHLRPPLLWSLLDQANDRGEDVRFDPARLNFFGAAGGPTSQSGHREKLRAPTFVGLISHRATNHAVDEDNEHEALLL